MRNEFDDSFIERYLNDEVVKELYAVHQDYKSAINAWGVDKYFKMLEVRAEIVKRIANIKKEKTQTTISWRQFTLGVLFGFLVALIGGFLAGYLLSYFGVK